MTTQTSIRFECDPHDKAMASAIAERHGGASVSSTMRRLIREEYERLHAKGELPPVVIDLREPAPNAIRQ